MIENKKIQVEVAYATLEKQLILTIEANEGDTIEDAIKRSGIIVDFPEIDLSVNKVGIFSKISKLDTAVKDKDRIEIYRPLIADPKEVRKQRAASGKRMRQGGGKIEGK
ncbi:MAG: RnfH family protein [Gammaproteobacteria bacterium]|nr:RnfH family protein [Gammaproteobacteria bacterium]